MIQAVATDENDRCAQGAWPLNTFSTPPLPATLSNDFRISFLKTTKFSAASIASVSVSHSGSSSHREFNSHQDNNLFV
jgi:hypothetical protein